jgi:hypothetical protein
MVTERVLVSARVVAVQSGVCERCSLGADRVLSDTLDGDGDGVQRHAGW